MLAAFGTLSLIQTRSSRPHPFSFLYDGVRIQDDDTPASLDMEDNGKLFPFLMNRSHSLQIQSMSWSNVTRFSYALRWSLTTL